ncbi:cytochrome b/b6 domain-containing protein [Azospirillum doebereinerae]|uniref:Cytochrome B n=1 Tax=Azospirillum doebereinerae TaxID=92933 RepID=A0A433JFK9_9PROT|nr:cytochrome b/b6 domain-containing protein [Azospirillum doebereinerae]MCG5240138.1 cytochrome b/b6 domain-containing protein [Azospirillum doebereinerae]RUQ75950.1 cytochrome B [Azospirillum doebereinerae]
MASGHTATREQRTREVPVWDLPTRLFHWSLAVLVAIAVLSAKMDVLWVHMLAGEAILSLVLFRLVWGVVGSQTARFADFVKGPRAILAYLGRKGTGGAAAEGATLGHNPLGALMVVALLLALGIQAVSGLFTSDDVLIDGPLVPLASSAVVGALGTLHRLLSDGILILTGLHVLAVFAYLLVRKDNLIRPMVTGRKTVATPVPAPRRASPALALAILAASAGLVAFVVRAAA